MGGHRSEAGQAIVLVIGAIAVAFCVVLVSGAVGQAMLGKGRHQRGVDLAAVCAGQVMRDLHPRLFEPARLPDGRINPSHLTRALYLSEAREAAVRCGRRNGVTIEPRWVKFVDAASMAPVRVAVSVRGSQRIREPVDSEVPIHAEAQAEIVPVGPQPSAPAEPSGGEYSGPLEYRQGKPMRPDVALAFDRMAAAARREAGIALAITSAFRSNAEQAALFATNPNPKWVAPPGTSLHRLGTELDIGPPSAYSWLASNSERFGFLRRYSWEPWHFGYSRNPGTTSVGFGTRSTPDGRRSSVPSFVPARYQEPIATAAQRWNVSAGLLAAQLYAESNFNPAAQSSAGAQGIAQFIPGTARAYGLSDPFDAELAIDAQAHLMRDLLRQFASVPLALAAYNAGPGAVSACGCIPPYPETRAYVAKILGVLSGGGELVGQGFEVKLVR